MTSTKYLDWIGGCILLSLSVLSCDKPLEPRSEGKRSLPIFINEFMAKNVSTVADEFGETNDWIELYNASDTTIALKKFYLTDSLTYPDRWRLPDTLMNSKGFLLVWADSDMQQGTLHASFRLNRNGEQIGVFLDRDGVLELIDSISYSRQGTDTSYGRLPDGAASWKYLSSPTPRAPNR